MPGRQRLRSAGRNYLVVPRHRFATYGRRAFVIAGPSAWNDLPDELRDISLSRTVIRSRLKTYFSPTTSAPSALEVFDYNALYKFMFTITITITLSPIRLLNLLTLWRYINQFLTFNI